MIPISTAARLDKDARLGRVTQTNIDGGLDPAHAEALARLTKLSQRTEHGYTLDHESCRF